MLGVVLLAAVLVGCDDAASPAEKTTPTPEVVESGALVVCTELPFKPFVYEEGGEPTGFELELLERIAAGMDLVVEIRPTPYADLVNGSALADDVCDVAAGALPITDEGAERMAFTQPHYDERLTLLVPSASDIESLADVSGRRLAVQEDSTARAYADRYAPSGTAIVEFPGDQYMIDALRQGRVDAILQDLPVNLVHARTGRFEVVDERSTGEQYAFAVRRDAPRLRRDLDAQLAALREDGTYDALYEEYFSAE